MPRDEYDTEDEAEAAIEMLRRQLSRERTVRPKLNPPTDEQKEIIRRLRSEIAAEGAEPEA